MFENFATGRVDRGPRDFGCRRLQGFPLSAVWQKRAKTGASAITLVTGLGLNYGLQVFDSYMVWLERRTTNDVLSVYRAPIAGANVAAVELVTAAAPGGYMTRRGPFKQADSLYRVPLEGGTAERLSTVTAADDSQATALFYVDDTYVYFVAGSSAGSSVVVRVAK